MTNITLCAFKSEYTESNSKRHEYNRVTESTSHSARKCQSWRPSILIRVERSDQFAWKIGNEMKSKNIKKKVKPPQRIELDGLKINLSFLGSYKFISEYTYQFLRVVFLPNTDGSFYFIENRKRDSTKLFFSSLATSGLKSVLASSSERKYWTPKKEEEKKTKKMKINISHIFK